VVVAFALWTAVPLLVLLTGHGVFNGAYGFDVPDVMQYMAFIRDAGQHLLISNRFDVVPDRHLFLDPVFAISGGIWRLGASIQAAQLLWVPVSAAALAVTFTAYTRRLLGRGTVAAAVALILAFLYLAPATSLSSWLHGSFTLQFGTQVVGEEMFAGAYAWSGGPAVAIALVPVFLLACERILDPARRPGNRSSLTYAVAGGLAGALTMWLHPWQGLTLLVIVLGLFVWDRDRRRYLGLVFPVALTLAPLAYFFALSHTHSSWMTVSRANDFSHFGSWLWVGLAPLVLVVPGLVGRGLDTQERILRLWPVAGLIVYLALDRTWFYHAFAGLSLPLAILAVRAGRRVSLPRVISLALVLLVTVPGLVWVIQQLDRTQSQRFFTPGEARALAFLDHARRPGPVLAAAMPLGQAVPAFTGRETYVGHYYWTPQYPARVALADQLFRGRLSRPQAAALVRSSRAVFLVADCRHGHPNLRALLGSLVLRSWRFGCATVYEIAPGSFQAQTVAPSGPRLAVHTT